MFFKSDLPSILRKIKIDQSNFFRFSNLDHVKDHEINLEEHLYK